MNDRVIGIIGGMGPEATADLYMKIIKATKVENDQDHFRVIIDSNPKIPDRTEAILRNGESPVETMIQTGKNLEKLGADICCIPCITAHYFIEELQKELSVKIVNALEEVNIYLKENYPKLENVGILATMGSVKTEIFKKYLPDFNIIYPNAKLKVKRLWKPYMDVKVLKGYLEGKPLNYLREASNELIDKGADVIIGGCTEITLALKAEHINKPLIDPMNIVAKRVVR